MDTDDFRLLVEGLDDLARLPGGIERLRDAVVELAMAGKLVEPARLDESVDDLLARITAERAALGLKGGVTVLEPQGTLPENWRLVSFGDILAHCRNGTGASPNDIGQGYPLLRISAGTSRPDGFVDMSDHKFVALTESRASPYLLHPGDLLACRFNGNLHYVGRVSQVPAEVSGPILHPDKLICMRAIIVSHAYLRYVLNSRFVRRQIESVAATTAGNIGINGKQVKALAIPLAPLSEQDRIAARLDEAFVLLDRLALEHNKEQSIRRILSRRALNELGGGKGGPALEMLEELIQTPDDAAAIEDAVLELAVNGHLTDNHVSDGVASELVSSARGTALDPLDLVNGRGTRVPDPYDLPATWEWVAFGAVLTDIEAGWSPNAQNRPKEGGEWGSPRLSGLGLFLVSAACRSKAGSSWPGSVPCRKVTVRDRQGAERWQGRCGMRCSTPGTRSWSGRILSAGRARTGLRRRC